MPLSSKLQFRTSARTRALHGTTALPNQRFADNGIINLEIGNEAKVHDKTRQRLGVRRLDAALAGCFASLVMHPIPKALIMREFNPSDKRSQTLALKPAGRELVPKLAEFTDENDKAFFRALAPGEKMLLRQFLQKMVSERQLTDVPTD